MSNRRRPLDMVAGRVLIAIVLSALSAGARADVLVIEPAGGGAAPSTLRVVNNSKLQARVKSLQFQMAPQRAGADACTAEWPVDMTLGPGEAVTLTVPDNVSLARCLPHTTRRAAASVERLEFAAVPSKAGITGARTRGARSTPIAVTATVDVPRGTLTQQARLVLLSRPSSPSSPSTGQVP